MRKRKGCPSPAQNQSNRSQLMVRFENSTLLIAPPKVLFKAKPRLTWLNKQSLTRTFLMPARLPSLNLTPAEAEESRQLVTLMFWQLRAGPHVSWETSATQSSPVSMAQLAIETCLHPSRSMPSAQTASFKLV